MNKGEIETNDGVRMDKFWSRRPGLDLYHYPFFTEDNQMNTSTLPRSVEGEKDEEKTFRLGVGSLGLLL